MGRKAITYISVLEELNRERLWCYKSITRGMQDNINLKEFRKVMMFNDITTSERKVRELWKLMEDLDFFRKVNQSDYRLVDLAAVAKVLGYEVVDVSSMTDHKESTAEGTVSLTSSKG